MRRYFNSAVRLLDTNPAAFFSWVMGGAALVLPLIVVPIRQSLGLPTNQWTKIMNK